MRITNLDVVCLYEGEHIDPNRGGGIEPMAVVRVLTDVGIVGISETFRVPPVVVKATVGSKDSYFGRLLIGQEITHPERLWQLVWDALMHSNRRGWQVIILGALDVAIWDAYGQHLGKPVWQLLGGVQRGEYQTGPQTRVDHVVPYCTIVSDEYDRGSIMTQQVARAEQLASLGYLGFKAEPLMCEPQTIIDLAREVRKTIGDDLMFAVDVGYLFHDVPTAAWVAERLMDYDVFFLETPFPVDHPTRYAELARRTNLPLAMGEHGVTRWEFLDMMDRGGVRVVQPYMTTCGGLTEAKRIVELAQIHGAMVIPGNWSSQLLGAATIHLAAYSPVTPFIEFTAAEVYASPLRTALQQAGFPVKAGRFHLPEKPGIGFDLPDEIVNDFAMPI